MSRKDEKRVDRDGVVPFLSPPGRIHGPSPDRPDRGRADAEGAPPESWPARVHVSEADRSELLNRIVSG